MKYMLLLFLPSHSVYGLKTQVYVGFTVTFLCRSSTTTFVSCETLGACLDWNVTRYDKFSKTAVPNFCMPTDARAIFSKCGGPQCPNLRKENGKKRKSEHFCT